MNQNTIKALLKDNFEKANLKQRENTGAQKHVPVFSPICFFQSCLSEGLL